MDTLPFFTLTSEAYLSGSPPLAAWVSPFFHTVGRWTAGPPLLSDAFRSKGSGIPFFVLSLPFFLATTALVLRRPCFSRHENLSGPPYLSRCEVKSFSLSFCFRASFLLLTSRVSAREYCSPLYNPLNAIRAAPISRSSTVFFDLPPHPISVLSFPRPLA